MVGFAPTTGGFGFGFGAGAGGFPPATVELGLDDAAELSEPSSVEICCALFHGAALPFDAAMPGNTETGFAEASAVTDCTAMGVLGFGAATEAGAGAAAVAAGAGGPGGARRIAGVGAGAGAGLGFGGTSSR